MRDQICRAIVLPLIFFLSSYIAPDSIQAQKQPNIILINLDDADHEILSSENLSIYFPHLNRFATEGISFTNFHVTTPLCGPSRACLLLGQYAHHTGIRTNDHSVAYSNGFDGLGINEYESRGHAANDVSMWLKGAGYRTMMVGKFLHGDTIQAIPPGWGDFYATQGSAYFGCFRHTNKFDPLGDYFWEATDTYRTTQETNDALDLLDQHIARENNQPFFLYLNPFAPHAPGPNLGSMIDPQYEQIWPGALSEWNNSDKSTAIRNIQRLNALQVLWLNSHYRVRLISLKSVDDMFAAIMQKLEEQTLDHTYIFLTSDNGFTHGHHRLMGKGDSFDRSTRVPMYLMGPGITGPAQANHLLAHIDIAPTIASLAQTDPPPEVDGISFEPLLYAPHEHDERDWRDAILIQNWEIRRSFGNSYNSASVALRMYDSIYTEWAEGSASYYDLSIAPHQLENRFDSLPESEKFILKG